MRDDLLVYGGLSVTTAAYAALLQRYAKELKWEPDFTFAEVIVGNLLCLAAAEIRAHLSPTDARGYRRQVFQAFVWGGLPIVAWQVWQMQRRYRDALDTEHLTLASHMEILNAPPAAPLANLRRASPPGGGSAG